MQMNGQHNQSQTVSENTEFVTLGGGCFWCLEAVFVELQGVKSVISGYAGGAVAHPTYEQVCAGATGHAEVVQVAFDPQAISYEEILDVFFNIHDPTTLNRQGADVGTQYRSVILYHDERQRQIAEHKIEEIEAAGTWGNPIVTEVVPLEIFYEAEAYHQGYFARNPGQSYCRVVIAPKVAKFRQHFATQLKR